MYYRIIAYAQEAHWAVVSGLSSRDAADRAMAALLAKDGCTQTDASGRRVAVTYAIEWG